MNESNISRDHVALEAMKVILDWSVVTEKTFFGKEGNVVYPEPEYVASMAYNYADAMIAERERRNQQQED
ncbi:hypothetical protein EVA_22258 [gut metagenome]|uniref:Uncharacterized protein n=1 Tax=gut metagenome TaxID=749906 RepID=J9F578_9ZZZZ